MGGPPASLVHDIQHERPPAHWLYSTLPHVWAPGSYAYRYHVQHYPISHPVPVRVCQPPPPDLESAYHRVREHLGHKLAQQKALYDKKVHGRPFECGDLAPLACNQGSSATPGQDPSVSSGIFRMPPTAYRMYAHPIIVLWCTLIASSCVPPTWVSLQSAAQPLFPLTPRATILSCLVLVHVWKS